MGKKTIEVTCILTEEQMKRLQVITDKYLSDGNPNWTNQMTLQLAVGTPTVTEIILSMLEENAKVN